jgi:hypothetical protein
LSPVKLAEGRKDAIHFRHWKKIIEPIDRALMPAGADQPFDIGFHQDLQDRLGNGSQEIALKM